MDTPSTWLAFGMSAVIKGTLVLALAFLATKALPNAPAAVRHWVWALSLLALLALPPASLVLPAWQIPVSTALVPAAAPDQREPSSFIAAPNLERSRTPQAPGEREQTTASSPPGPPVSSWSWIHIASLVWLGGVLLFSSRLVYGLIAIRREVKRSSRVADESWNGLLDEIAGRVGLARKIQLLQTQCSMLPITCGFFRTRILLPAEADQWADDRRRSVLLHELAHVRRRDLLTQMLTQVACAAYWWNPLAWYAAGKLRQESERACDDMVLDAGTRASDYAHDLLEMARALHTTRRSPLSSVALAHRSRFEDRLLAILNPKLARHALSRFGAGLVALAAGALLLPLAALQPSAQAREPAAPPHAVSARELVAGAGTPVLVGQVPVTTQEVAEDPNPSPPPTAQPQPPEEEPPEEKEDEEESVVNERAAAALMGALSDPEASVRAQAVTALGQLEYAPAVEPLMGALQDEDAEIRENAAWALGQIGDDRAVGPLSSALKDSEPAVREQAAWALGQIEAEQSAEALAASLVDEDPDVREQAAWALGMIQSTAAVHAVMEALKDSDPDVRQQAAWALGMIQSTAAVHAVMEALKDSDPDVRQQAAWALGMIQDENAIDALSEALGDEDPDVREQAAWALGMVAKQGRKRDRR